MPMITMMNSLRRTYLATMYAKAIDRRTNKKVEVEIPIDVPFKMVNDFWDRDDFLDTQYSAGKVREGNLTLFNWLRWRLSCNLNMMGYQLIEVRCIDFQSMSQIYKVTEY